MRGLLARSGPATPWPTAAAPPRAGSGRRPAASLPELRARWQRPGAEAPEQAPPAPSSRWILPSVWQVDAARWRARADGRAPRDQALAADACWRGDALRSPGCDARRCRSGAQLAATVAYSAVARPTDADGLPPTSLLVVIPLVTGAVCALPRLSAPDRLSDLRAPPCSRSGGTQPAEAAPRRRSCWPAGLRPSAARRRPSADGARGNRASVRDESAVSAGGPSPGTARIARDLHTRSGTR